MNYNLSNNNLFALRSLMKFGVVMLRFAPNPCCNKWERGLNHKRRLSEALKNNIEGSNSDKNQKVRFFNFFMACWRVILAQGSESPGDTYIKRCASVRRTCYC
jgi:hypothetical protein